VMVMVGQPQLVVHHVCLHIAHSLETISGGKLAMGKVEQFIPALIPILTIA
jgi:hypothetical protein